MSYVGFYQRVGEPPSGAAWGLREDVEQWPMTIWRQLWTEFVRTQLAREFFQTTTTVVISLSIETFPRASMALRMESPEMLRAIERVFGDSESDLAKMLRVSRPMIYHYRHGKEPSDENRQRLCALAEFASEWTGVVSNSLQSVLKKKQPEGRSLLDFLSDSPLDMVALRKVVGRSVDTHDRGLRKKLATELSRTESAGERQDIVRERRSERKPIYIGDPQAPEKLVQVLPDGRRVRGRLVNRRFVPDET
jgi:predicted transcriptional regulator